MSRSLKSAEAEQAAISSALTSARSAVEKATLDVVDAETRVLTVSTAADPKNLATAEAALRQAEAVRTSARRRLELLEEAAARAADEADAIRRGDAVAAARNLRAQLAARFQDAEERFVQAVAALVAATSELDSCSRRDRTMARYLADLGAASDAGGPCYEGWNGQPPYPHGTNAVARGIDIARERLAAYATAGTVTFHLPTLTLSE